MAFVDTQHGWAVGGWQDGQRTIVVHTDDGAMTWQAQDTHISMPPLAYTSAAHLTSYLAQRDPPLEILLARLFPGPCSLEEHSWMINALYNLGWDGTTWGERPVTPEGFSVIQRLDADLDQDGIDEIVLYSEFGGLVGKWSQVFAAVLDWDGMYWQVAWFNRVPTHYNGGVQVRLDDIDADGQPELWVDFLAYGTGTGYLSQDWDLSILRCNHLHCSPVWTEGLGYIERWGGAGGLGYSWSGSDYRLLDLEQGAQSGLELQQYGLTFQQTSINSGTLTVDVMPISQTVYFWDGAQYTPTLQTELEPGYTLDTRPLTETLDLDGDGRIEIIACETSFLITYELTEAEEWPSMQPRCTVIDLTGLYTRPGG
jgi:hypothetical protein